MFKELAKAVVQWAESRGIMQKSSPIRQWDKLQEEVQELREAIECGHRDAIIDAIGDTLVVLIIIAKMHNIDIERSLFVVYEELCGREGEIDDGIFRRFLR